MPSLGSPLSSRYTSAQRSGLVVSRMVARIVASCIRENYRYSASETAASAPLHSATDRVQLVLVTTTDSAAAADR